MEANLDLQSLGHIFKELSLAINEKDSGYRSQLFQSNIKALYVCLQKYQEEETFKLSFRNYALQLFDFITRGIDDNLISTDILLVTVSTLILLIPLISTSPTICFSSLLNSSVGPFQTTSRNARDKFNTNDQKLDVTNSFARTFNSLLYYEELKTSDANIMINCNIFEFKDVVPSFNTYIYLHSILNTKPTWLFSQLSFYNDKPNNNSNTSSDHCTFNNLLFAIWPLISQLCLTTSSHSYQSLQVLHLWLKIVKQYLKKFECFKISQEDEFDLIVNSDMNQDKEIRNLKKVKQNSRYFCSLCHDASISELFSVEIAAKGKIFNLLNLNWENKHKGSSVLIQQCMMELLYLHESMVPGHAIATVTKMVKSVINSAIWHTKGTYLQIHMALNFICVNKIFEVCPKILQHMSKCLQSCNVVSAVTNLYHSMLVQLKNQDWLIFFANEHAMICNCSDKILRHNYFILWLPLTISQFPDLLSQLLFLCNDSLAGWQSKLAILRIAKGYNLISLGDWKSPLPNIQNYSVSMNHKEMMLYLSNQLLVCDIIYTSIIHGDELIRSDALNFLSNSKKSSEPFSYEEIKLIKCFYEDNLNTNTPSFSQSLFKSFSKVVQRLRDSSAAEIKKLSDAHIMVEKDSFSKILKESLGPDEIEIRLKKEFLYSDKMCYLDINNMPKSNLFSNFVIWFMDSLCDNLSILGNYSRILLALKLFFHLLSTIYDLKTGKVIPRFHSVIQVIDRNFKTINLSKHMMPQYPQALFPEIMNSLFNLCTHEMNDVKELAADIIILLCKIDNNLCSGTYNSWFRLSLQLINSPKYSIAESGTILLKVLMSITYNNDAIAGKSIDFSQIEPKVFKILKNVADLQDITNSLVEKIKKVFEMAQDNILYCSLNAPFYGPIRAVTVCLIDAATNQGDVCGSFIRETIKFLINLYQQIIEFILEIMAKKSVNSSRVSPSFAEIGEAIEEIILECRKNLQTNGECSASELLSDFAICADDSFIEPNNESRVYDHQMVLSFCWQTLKVCCWSCGRFTSKWHSLIDLETQDLIVSGIVIRVLTGTRHKGAMEAAYSALQDIAAIFYKTVFLTTKEKILESQMNLILLNLECETETSVTRRSAGLSMIFTAICQSIPLRNRSDVTISVMKRLLGISQMKVATDIDKKDISPALGLHILHSMISCASLTVSTSPLWSDVCITCLNSFNSKSWAVRNASLQLYGAVVARLIGQKNVKDDSSSFNTITAAEFCSRNMHLCSVIIERLELCRIPMKSQFHWDKSNDENKHTNVANVRETSSNRTFEESDEDLVKSNFTYEQTANLYSSFSNSISNCSKDTLCGATNYLELNPSKSLLDQPQLNLASHEKLTFNSSLVPILSLLARLNPGSEIQQNDQIKNIIVSLVEKIISFLSYPILTVRRLAASALCSLTSVGEVENLKEYLIKKGFHNIKVNSNMVNGCLITLKTLFESSSNNYSQHNIHNLLNAILSEQYFVYANKCLALDIANILNIKFCVALPKNIYLPGYALLVKKITKMDLQNSKFDDSNSIFIMMKSSNSDILEEVLHYLKLNLKLFEKEFLFILQRKFWICITHFKSNMQIQLRYAFKALTLLLNEIALDTEAAIPCLPLLQQVLETRMGNKLSQYCLIVVSHCISKFEIFQAQFNVNTKNLIDIWTKTIELFSSSSSAEDYRLAAVNALHCNILLINYNPCFSRLRIIKVVFDLIQDENQFIRLKSCRIVQLMTQFQCPNLARKHECMEFCNPLGLNKQYCMREINSENRWNKSNIVDGPQPTDDVCDRTFDIKLNEQNNFIDLFLKNEYNVNKFGNVDIQPNVALKLFISYLVVEALSQEKIELFMLLIDHFEVSYSNKCDSLNLFDSDADNIYKEPHVICKLIYYYLKMEIPKYSSKESFKINCREYIYIKVKKNQIFDKNEENSNNPLLSFKVIEGRRLNKQLLLYLNELGELFQ